MKSCIVLLRFLRDARTIKFGSNFFPGFRCLSSAKSHYEVLGLSPSCSNSEIKKAYVKLCKQLHPDVKPEDTTQHKKFVELNNAYSTLINSETRKAYNRNFGSDGGHNHQGTRYSSSFYTDAWSDEPIWYYRQKSQEDFYRDTTDFGVNQRLSNNWIILGCFTLMLIGTVLYFSAYSFATKYTHNRIDAKSRKISKEYLKAKETAQEHGKQRQLEKFHQHWGLSKSILDDK